MYIRALHMAIAKKKNGDLYSGKRLCTITWNLGVDGFLLFSKSHILKKCLTLKGWIQVLSYSIWIWFSLVKYHKIFILPQHNSETVKWKWLGIMWEDTETDVRERENIIGQRWQAFLKCDNCRSNCLISYNGEQRSLVYRNAFECTPGVLPTVDSLQL